MFGLEGKAKKKKEFVFDLENTMKDAKKRREMKEHVDKQQNKIKSILREGGSQEDFDQFEVLLYGYAALNKVLGKIPSK